MRYTQPQSGPIALDRGHPIARGLVSYLPLVGKTYQDAADSVAWTLSATATPVAFAAAPRGLGLRVKGATPSYVSRPVPPAITSSSTQPISFRFRLVFFSIGSTNTALMSWGSTPQDGTPRFYMRLNGAGQLEFFFSGGYHSDFIVSVVAGREYIFEWDFDGATHRGKLNGVPLPGSSASGWGGNSAAFYLGMGFDGANASTDFLISDFAMWSRSRSTQESASDTQNPWQFIKSPQRMLPLSAVAIPANDIGSSSGATTAAGSATVATSIALSSSGQSRTVGNATLATAVALAVSGQAATTGGATVTTQLSLSASGATPTVAAAALATQVALAVSGATSASGSTAPTTAITLTVSARTSTAGTTVFAASGALSVTAGTPTTGSAAVGTQISLTAQGSAALAGAVGLATQIALAAAGTAATGGSVAFAITPAGVTVTGGTRTSGAASVTTVISISASTATRTNGTVALVTPAPVPGSSTVGPISITRKMIITALRAFILAIAPQGQRVIQTPVNRAAMPVGAFVAMTPGGSGPLSTNVTTLHNDGTRAVQRPTKVTYVVDCYGPESGDLAEKISILFRDQFAIESFGSVAQPLFSSDATQMPIVSGEEQYEERWQVELSLQYNPIVSTAQQSANMLEVGLFNVDRNTTLEP